MKFSIIIPAYNEENAVEDILRRSLKSAEMLKSAGLGIEDVEIILVSDGSHDRTEERARKVSGIQVIAYPKNRGYGAAIKTGFEAAKGDWVGFLDSDGTCAPDFFKDLIEKGQKEGLDVVLGSRLHPGSKMPPVRVFGNVIFRTVVSLIAGEAVGDVASGMRVMRRDALDRLYPLPDGLHFTPAMSVRAILDPELKIGELPMPYEERVGRSKLSVVVDGLRFLSIILQTAITYRPALFFFFVAAALAAPAFGLLLLRLGAPTAAPVPFYIENQRIADWMLFRLILIMVLLATAVFLVSLGAVAQSLIRIINHEREGFPGLAGKFMAGFPLWGILSLGAALFIVRRPLTHYWMDGTIPQFHWVFPVVAALFAIIGCEFLAFYVVSGIARLLWERERFRRGSGGPGA